MAYKKRDFRKNKPKPLRVRSTRRENINNF
jgi:hypothetical protein